MSGPLAVPTGAPARAVATRRAHSRHRAARAHASCWSKRAPRGSRQRRRQASSCLTPTARSHSRRAHSPVRVRRFRPRAATGAARPKRVRAEPRAAPHSEASRWHVETKSPAMSPWTRWKRAARRGARPTPPLPCATATHGEVRGAREERARATRRRACRRPAATTGARRRSRSRAGRAGTSVPPSAAGGGCAGRGSLPDAAARRTPSPTTRRRALADLAAFRRPPRAGGARRRGRARARGRRCGAPARGGCAPRVRELAALARDLGRERERVASRSLGGVLARGPARSATSRSRRGRPTSSDRPSSWGPATVARARGRTRGRRSRRDAFEPLHRSEARAVVLARARQRLLALRRVFVRVVAHLVLVHDLNHRLRAMFIGLLHGAGGRENASARPRGESIGMKMLPPAHLNARAVGDCSTDSQGRKTQAREPPAHEPRPADQG